MIKCLHTDDLYCLQHYNEIICENKETCRAIYARGKQDAVRYGHWYKKGKFLGVFCTSCGLYADNGFDYCPNCGAKMDGDVSE